MSARKTINDIKKKKAKEKITALTAYDHYHARVLDEAGIDIVLVGDSLGMVFSGYENTLPVTVDDIYYHASAVSRGAKTALVTADMPFLSYQTDNRTALKNCGRLIKDQVAGAVKIEGGNKTICRRINKLVETGIPVMGHIGLTPQLISTLGGYKTQGRTRKDIQVLKDSARRLEDAGVFCMVLEAIPMALGEEITAMVSVPTIGIGAGGKCDGQILVISDVLGMFDEFKPKFARRYVELGSQIKSAVRSYVNDVKQGDFPNDSESYS